MTEIASLHPGYLALVLRVLYRRMNSWVTRILRPQVDGEKMEVERQEGPLYVSASLFFSGGISKLWGEVSLFQTLVLLPTLPSVLPALLSFSLSSPLCLGESGSLVLQMKPKPGGFQSLGNLVGCCSLAHSGCVHYWSYHGERAGQTERVCPFVFAAEHVLVIIFSFEHLFLSNPLYLSHFCSLSASVCVCVCKAWVGPSLKHSQITGKHCVCVHMCVLLRHHFQRARDGGGGARLKPKACESLLAL